MFSSLLGVIFFSAGFTEWPKFNTGGKEPWYVPYVKKSNLWNKKKFDFDLQGYPRSKGMMSNDSLIMISYLTLIVTIYLACSVSEILSLQVFCLIKLIRLLNFIRSWSKTIGIYSSGRWDRFQKMKKIELEVKKLSLWQNCPDKQTDKIFPPTNLTIVDSRAVDYKKLHVCINSPCAFLRKPQNLIWEFSVPLSAHSKHGTPLISFIQLRQNGAIYAGLCSNNIMNFQSVSWKNC